MRMILGLAVLAVPAALAAASTVSAQPYASPPGSYQSHCTNIRMNGQFLSATCRGAHGAGPSSINVESCSTGIFVDDAGALACIGPGGGKPPEVRNAPPGFATTTPTPAPVPSPDYGRRGYDGRDYDQRDDRRDYDRRDDGRGEPRAYGERWRGRDSVELFRGPGFRGPSIRIDGPEPNLGDVGLNDHVRSIRLPRGSGPWRVCSDAGFHGHCVTIWRSVDDTRELGLRDSISSIGPGR